MNERITLLALKASDPKTGWLDRQKFAQLIVQECLELCQYESEDDDDQFDLGRVHQAKQITHFIKEHFGEKL